jgi:O-antigen/teichoic acid export membrane protein
VMQALAAFTLLRLVATVWLLMRQSQGPLWRTRTLREQAHYAVPFGASVLLARPTAYAHQYAVSAAVGPSLFGLYSVGCFQLPVVDLLYSPTTEVLMVHLGELEREQRMDEAAGAFRAAAARLAFFFLPLAAVLFICAPEFIGALFGPRFLEAVPVFRVSVLGILMSVLPIDGALRSRNLTRHIFLGALAKAALMLPLAFWSVSRFGMMGGIVSWVVGEAFGKAVLFVKVPVALAAPGKTLTFAEVVPWRELGRAAAATGVGILVALAAKGGLAAVGLVPEGGFVMRLIPLALLGTAFAGGYLAGLPLVGVRPLALLRRPRAPALPGVA